MEPRSYRLGRRQAAVDRNRAAILSTTREMLATGNGRSVSVGAVARRAGVSRLTIYNRFGSRAGLLRAVIDSARPSSRSPSAAAIGDPRARLRQRINESCVRWASDPALFRRLPELGLTESESTDDDRALAEELATADQLRPGCSLKEAEDVIGTLASFATFDRLHKDGRRSVTAVSEILLRLASAILVSA
jgi:AcrR family transcriptional regulator